MADEDKQSPLSTAFAEASQKGPEQRFMSAVAAAKTGYDAEFDRLQAVFAPLTQATGGEQPRSILFIDPLEVANAGALGISGERYLSSTLTGNGLAYSESAFGQILTRLQAEDDRTRRHPAVGTIRASATDVEHTQGGYGSVVLPAPHVGNDSIGSLGGLKPGEISTYINYHEFFHCLDNRPQTGSNLFHRQTRETFADVGATLEMIRRGADPAVIDHVINWRKATFDPIHRSVDALGLLKEDIARHGVDNVRKLGPKEVIARAYAFTDRGLAGHENDSPHSLLLRTITDWIGSSSYGNASEGKLPRDWDPRKLLEDKAFALGGKITPITLMQANTALQTQYRRLHETGSTQGTNYPEMMMGMQDALATTVRNTDYAAVNRARNATLTPQDHEDIAFIRNGGTAQADATAPKPPAAKR